MAALLPALKDEVTEIWRRTEVSVIPAVLF